MTTYNGFLVKRIDSALQHPSGDYAIILEDREGEKLALILNAQTGPDVSGAILGLLPQGDNEQFGIVLANDLKAVEQIDNVAVGSDDTRDLTPYELDFQFAGQSRVKLQLSWSEAVRFMHKMKHQISERVRKITH